MPRQLHNSLAGQGSNLCPTCGLTEAEYALPLTTPRPAIADRETWMGLPVLTWQDWQPAYAPPDPIIGGVLAHRPIFRVVWGPCHAIAHEVLQSSYNISTPWGGRTVG